MSKPLFSLIKSEKPNVRKMRARKSQKDVATDIIVHEDRLVPNRCSCLRDDWWEGLSEFVLYQGKEGRKTRSDWHLATLPLVSPPNDVWETSADIPYWWRVTTKIWVVLLICWTQISHAARSIRSTTQIWVVTRHQYGISALVPQTSFGGVTSGSVAKFRLFSQATGRKSKFSWTIYK